MTRQVFAAALLLFAAFTVPARAIDPGRADGTLRVNELEIPLTHAYAQMRDDAEGVLGRPRELRIAVVDREIPQASLNGLGILPISEMALAGEVRGVLLAFDPDDPDELVYTLLFPSEEPGFSLLANTLSRTGEPLWERFSLGEQTVSGVLHHRDEWEHAMGSVPSTSFELEMRAPLFHEPEITEDLRGEEALRSPFVDLLRRRAVAMRDGDLATLRALGSSQANRRVDAYLAMPEMSEDSLLEMLGGFSEEQIAAVETIERVVVRGDRAVAIYAADEEGVRWSSFVREGGEWKSDD